MTEIGGYSYEMGRDKGGRLWYTGFTLDVTPRCPSRKGLGLMEELVCPHCKKVSYSASARAFSPCPHCKFRFAISEEEDQKYLVIDRKLEHMVDEYADSVNAGKEIEVIVDRREKQRPFSGVDSRKVTTNY